MMRVLHTSDWHLGHVLREFTREHEHEAFLGWLNDVIEHERVDALLVAGDVFDTSNPSAAAEQAWFDFLVEARRRAPRLQVVVIAGNHDAAARLEAPSRLLSAIGVTVVGAMHRGDAGATERACVPLVGASGEVAAWVAAVPFLRAPDLPHMAAGDVGDPLVAGVGAVYRGVFEAIAARRKAGQAVVAMGHLYAVGGLVSELSERKVLGGNLHAIPAGVFPEATAYTALGHLHLAQRVGGRDAVRYAGSPLPMSIAEAGYEHQVVMVDLEGEGVRDLRPMRVPRSVEVWRVPRDGALVIDALEVALRALDAPTSRASWQWPFLEVAVAVERPLPGLVRRIEDALADKGVRLVRIVRELQGSGQALPESVRQATLADLTADDVLREMHRSVHGGEPSGELYEAFHELIDAAGQGRERRGEA